MVYIRFVEIGGLSKHPLIFQEVLISELFDRKSSYPWN